MTEHQGPLDALPRVNYQPLLTNANYYSTKQMIDQVLSEDQDYVSWKLKELRTGGTMNSFLNLENYNTGTIDEDEEEEEEEGEEERTYPDDQINTVPKDVTFVRDIYDETMEEEMENIKDTDSTFEELSYDDQFKLLVLNLDEEQSNRFEVFHRTSLNKGQVKKLANTVCGQTIGENIRVFLQAIGKVFAGEIIELALDVRKRWFINKMVSEFDRRKEIGKRLKKYLKKLTILVENNNDNTNVNNDINGNDGTMYDDSNIGFENDSIDENESDFYFDDEEAEMKEIQIGNELLKNEKNTQDVRLGLITRYNKLVKEFNTLDVSFEKYNNSPVLPEHIREAWRLYQMQKDDVISTPWRGQGESNGAMFR